MNRSLLSVLLLPMVLAAEPAPTEIGNSRVVMVVYRAHAGKEQVLRELLEKHVRVLREEKLATDRPPLFLRSRDGFFVEIFEWRSSAAIDAAHENLRVQALWAEFERACDYKTLADLLEAGGPFAEFEAMTAAGATEKGP